VAWATAGNLGLAGPVGHSAEPRLDAPADECGDHLHEVALGSQVLSDVADVCERFGLFMFRRDDRAFFVHARLQVATITAPVPSKVRS
jgi:hypothetical protein